MKELKDTFQHINEWNSLLNHVSGQLQSFIEIGTYKGGTFSSLADITSGKKISIDLCSGGFGGIGAQASRERNDRLSNEYKDSYFIEGDSKQIDTVLKLNDILKGEKVDLLFIDGDHTYKGVLADYMIYRQFVKQGGFIAFHDIVDSDFHRMAGCFVSTFWNHLNETKTEYISPDNSDCSFDAQNMGSNIWGGIGIITKQTQKVNIFQVIYDQLSIDQCIEQVGCYIPELILNTDNVFFENNAIIKVWKEYKFSHDAFVGITSPIVNQKLNLSIDNIVSSCNFDYDVINYWDSNICKLDVWDENRANTCLLYDAAKELEDAKILKNISLFENKWVALYCNYFVAKARIFDYYCKEYLNPAITYLMATKWCEWDNPSTGLKYKQGRYYPMATFVCEALFGTLLANNPYYRVKKIF